jgi:competence protein ComEC
MAATSDGDLHVYMVNVGQADTTVIVSPGGRVIVIDAVRPGKLLSLLDDLGCDGTIEHLILTHPHSDHFSGGNRLASETRIVEATVAPFWHAFGLGPPTYRRLMGRLHDQGTNLSFLSGYSRWYPDGSLALPSDGGDPEADPRAPFVELLGPTNGLVRELEDADVFNTNHLTIMTRLTWGDFRMISAGDAQLENWSFFDRERLMEDRCQVLRAAHHGSPNGTQWERIDRLSPSQLIVSCDPSGGHQLPDLTAAAIFAKFDSVNGQMAVATRDSGSIHMRVRSTGTRSLERYGDSRHSHIDLAAAQPLNEMSNPTDWDALLAERVASL